MYNYTFLPELVLRTPIKSFSSELTEKETIRLLKNTNFLESVFLASPSLYQAILTYNQGKLSQKSQKDVLKSAAKYIIRSRSRSTPFGLFASNSMLKWGNETSISLNPNYNRKTQLDFGTINGFYNKVRQDSVLIEKIKFYSNPTYYVFQDEIRYIEKTADQNETNFQISALEKNDFILFILNEAKSGLTIYELSNILLQEGVEIKDGRPYILSLIESQILINNLEPSLNATDKLEDLINLHQSIGTEEPYINKLRKIQIDLNQVDQEDQGNIENYPKLDSSVSKKAFHTECFTELKQPAVLDEKFQNSILDALAVLNTLKIKEENTRLDQFKARFKRRFGSEEVPLLIALDTEKGIGYDKEFDIVKAPLIENLDLVPVQNSADFLGTPSFLDKILKKAYEQKLFEIKLEHEDIGKIDYQFNLSASSSVLFRIIGDNKIHLEAAGGSSAINLICRFANTSKTLGKLVAEIAAEEIKNNPNVTFAEIIHLPNPKLGNVLSRKSVFEQEISFLGLGSSKKQFALRDLVIFIQDSKLFLKDKESGQIIIPKLNCTHNVTQTALPVYKFLYDLQFQGLDGSLKFEWRVQKQTSVFYPRVSYKGIVLSLAVWKFEHIALNKVKKLKSIDEFKVWCSEQKLPTLFVISEGDNDLLIDTNSDFLIELFMESVKNKKLLTIKEFLFDKSQPVRSSDGEPVINQLIGSIVNSSKTYSIPQKPISKNNKNQPVQILLDPALQTNWLYIKVYCPLASVDSIFSNEMENLLQVAFEKKLINKWFFIRYRDPDFHLRIRFHLKDLGKATELVALINLHLLSQEDIWKVEMDQYQQENERYAAIGIEAAESFFCFESNLYLRFLANSDVENREEARWLYALKYTSDLVSFFDYSLPEKLRFITILRNGFAEEFGLTQVKKKQLDKLYREHRTSIASSLAEPKNKMPEISLDIKCKEETDFEKSTLAGLTHMWINRIMNTQQRLHEFIIYDFLMRTYRSILAQQKS